MQYLALIHNNTVSDASNREWEEFIEKAIASKMFKGGSSLGKDRVIGAGNLQKTDGSLRGFMRFDAKDLDALNDLLSEHPVIKHGGSIELYEMPPTK